ncbi:MAG: hypothetical protein Q7S65_05095 [Nanoarchaeota archaeon]|nr:hypothetical protein [Nanoarchaeota archaeon]
MGTPLREQVEEALLERYAPHLRPFTPQTSLDAHKDGSYGVSALSVTMYATGNNLRGMSRHRFGLFYDDGTSFFAVGYFQKELDPPGSEGYLFLVAPRGKDVLAKVADISEWALSSGLPCKGAYARFLSEDQRAALLLQGFSPISASPWHPDAPQEDETYCHSIVALDALLDVEGPKSVPLLSPNSRRKAIDGFNRFGNFLARNGFTFSLEERVEPDEAKGLLNAHFESLRQRGKLIGSTPEDHYNSLDFSSVPGVYSFMPRLQGVPVALFVGERLSSERLGLYTSITRWDTSTLASIPELRNPAGFGGLTTYAYLAFFRELRAQGFKEAHLGGSEVESLNTFKRRLGAKEDPTHWAVLLP